MILAAVRMGGVPVGDLIEIDSPSVTGINTSANSIYDIHLFPNPASTSIHLSLTLQQEQSIVLTLYNTLSQQVWAEDLGKTNQVETEIPLTNLTNGVYILKVNNGGESVQKEVIVEK